MIEEFFKTGASVEIILKDDPTAEEDDDLVVSGYMIERDNTGVLLDTGDDQYGRMFIPWSNVSQVLAVEFEESEDELVEQ